MQWELIAGQHLQKLLDAASALVCAISLMYHALVVHLFACFVLLNGC
jgi:hypothetical protein